MSQVEVRIFKRGQEITRVMRPLRRFEGKPFVKYKRQFWPLVNNNEVYLDNIPPADDLNMAESTGAEDTDVLPECQVVSPAHKDWDESQQDVIDAAPDDLLLVGAGPGTGKTAVACARVSKLIEKEDLEPSSIWLISFTRTAVREIRERIAAYLQDSTAAYAVRIATLDSHAWSIHSGFDENAKILGSYEENIERVLNLVRQEENVAEYLESVEHLIVDEAQDIVGIRGDLIIEIILNLSSSCGVTVFADEAQAIYGFAEDREVRREEVKEPPLPEKIRYGSAGVFRECELTKVHRTHSPKLLKIFSDTRQKVLSTTDETEDKCAKIRDEVTSLAHGKAPNLDDESLADLEDTLILYRRRCDVLQTSSFLMQKDIPHRVRMSGLPMILTPWIGASLSKHTDIDLPREKFMELWAGNVAGTSLETCEANDAWAHLVQIAGRTQTVVDMRLLRQRLGRKKPPAELCHSDLGLCGPVVGTIHASKGREASTVNLMLTNQHGHNVDQDEEARVIFVGATRGRSRLLIGHGYHQYPRRAETSGRVYCLKTKKNNRRAQFEVGREGDITADGLAGRSNFTSPDAVKTAQNRILSFAEESGSLVAECDRDADFIYRLKEDEQGKCLAVLSKTVNNDLFDIAKAIEVKLSCGKLRPPPKIRHLNVRGLRTIVLPPDSPEVEMLYEPWRSSGIMVAPLVLGFSTEFFPFRRKQRRQ